MCVCTGVVAARQSPRRSGPLQQAAKCGAVASAACLQPACSAGRAGRSNNCGVHGQLLWPIPATGALLARSAIRVKVELNQHFIGCACTARRAPPCPLAAPGVPLLSAALSCQRAPSSCSRASRRRRGCEGLRLGFAGFRNLASTKYANLREHFTLPAPVCGAYLPALSGLPPFATGARWPPFERDCPSTKMAGS